VFFATGGGEKATHVGIFSGSGRFIHAPGRNRRIRVEDLSHPYYEARFIGARTYF